MSKKIGLVTILLGAGAVAALAYGVTRRGASRRAMETPPHSESGLAWGTSRDGEAERLTQAEREFSTAPDPLDLALDLEGIFDADSGSAQTLSVQFSDRVPSPMNGDDQDPPSPDDLGRAWLEQATESEPSLSPDRLAPELENLSLDQLAAEARDDADAEDADAEDTDADESELGAREFPRRARA